MAEIDLQALRQNVDFVRARIGPSVGILAVVKADAYGHGAVACARALERKVWGFAVSLVEEGIELRRGGVEAPIVVLGSFYGLSHRDVVAYRLTPVVSAVSDLSRFVRAAEDLEVPRLGIHLKVDTGMSRLGVQADALPLLADAIAASPRLLLEGLCTHLAEADAGESEVSVRQLVRLDEARVILADKGLRPTVVHVANSAGTARFVGARADLVRPGLALYGDDPGHQWAGLVPVMRLRSRIVALREIKEGSGVSYGALFRAQRDTRIATVPIGYADGYTRRMSGKAQLLVAGRRCPVVGAITMDMLMADVTDVPECAVGDEVVLLGAQGQERIHVAELADWAGTISWEILCGISKRVPRVYLGSV